MGIDYVQPEDSYIAMNDYELHMRVVEYLHQAYPHVRISLHAGNCTRPRAARGPLLPYSLGGRAGACGAIGHGVDVMYEKHPYDLLKEMAAKHVMVEINLTSNDVILGVTGKEHPLPVYRQFGVPVPLSTDDEGISRIDITHEYERAVETYGLSYADLKQMARTGIEHSFLPGASLWAAPDDFSRVECSVFDRNSRRGKPHLRLRRVPAIKRTSPSTMGARAPLSNLRSNFLISAFVRRGKKCQS